MLFSSSFVSLFLDFGQNVKSITIVIRQIYRISERLHQIPCNRGLAFELLTCQMSLYQ